MFSKEKSPLYKKVILRYIQLGIVCVCVCVRREKWGGGGGGGGGGSSNGIINYNSFLIKLLILNLYMYYKLLHYLYIHVCTSATIIILYHHNYVTGAPYTALVRIAHNILPSPD